MSRTKKDAVSAEVDAVAPIDLSKLAALLEAWGVRWEDVRGRLEQAESHLPVGVRLTVDQVVAVLDAYLNRSHQANMLAMAAGLVMEALSKGTSENELDPSALS